MEEDDVVEEEEERHCAYAAHIAGDVDVDVVDVVVDTATSSRYRFIDGD